MPLADGAFDGIVCCDAVQHLKDPMTCFKEFSRVLKVGGLCFVKTANLWNYAVLVTRLTPNWFHNWYMKHVVICIIEQDPVYYRANTPGKLIAMMREAGFDVVSLILVEDKPEYLRFSPITYAAGIALQRLANRFAFLSRFRGSGLLVVLKKSNNEKVAG